MSLTKILVMHIAKGPTLPDASWSHAGEATCEAAIQANSKHWPFTVIASPNPGGPQCLQECVVFSPIHS